MPIRNVKVHIEAPAGISAEAKEHAQHKAHETVVLTLWEAGEITASRAAEELSLSVHGFLDLLAVQGLPVVRGPLNVEAVEAAQRKLAPDRP